MKKFIYYIRRLFKPVWGKVCYIHGNTKLIIYIGITKYTSMTWSNIPTKKQIQTIKEKLTKEAKKRRDISLT